MLSRCLHGLLSERRYQIPALFLVCLITYSSVFVADYVHFDEHVEILDNHLITAPFSAASLWKILVSFEANQYTPLSLISFWVEYNLAGFNSTLSHLLGFVLHFLCVLLVYDLSRELLNDAAKAVMAAAIWAVHPLQVETVAWVLERRNILFGLFYLASLSAYCRFIKSRKSGLLLMACVFMHVSGLAKTIEFMLPLNWLMLDWYYRRSDILALIREKIPGLLIAAFLAGLLFWGAYERITVAESGGLHWQMAAYNTCFYLAKSFLPLDLSPTYEISDLARQKFRYGPAYLLLVLSLIVFFGRRNRLFAFAACFYLVHIIPLSGLIRVGYKFYAVPHFMYIALLPVILAAMAIWDSCLSMQVRQRFGHIIGLTIVLLLSAQSFVYSQVWQNSQVLFEHCLRHDPDCRFARNQRAYYFENKGMLKEAVEQYQELARRHAQIFGGYYGQGRILMRIGEYRAAEFMLTKAVQYNQGRQDILVERGNLFLIMRKFVEAEADLNHALMLKQDTVTRFLRSEALKRQGRYEEAIIDLEQVIDESPDDFAAKISLFELQIEGLFWRDALVSLLAVGKTVLTGAEPRVYYMSMLFNPDLLSMLKRLLPYRNYCRFRLGWYPM